MGGNKSRNASGVKFLKALGPLGLPHFQAIGGE